MPFIEIRLESDFKITILRRFLGRDIMPQPLCEVFGFPVSDFSEEAIRYRQNKLCPYNNRVPQCTKDKANDPLGVCSMFENGRPVIICPIRFRQDWKIIADTQEFLLPNTNDRVYVTEVGLKDANNETAGNIDVVIIKTEGERIVDFGALEVQAVYISGNIREPFKSYIEDPSNHYNTNWHSRYYPSPDWLSSIKRLEHQLIAKGRIFNTWGKRMAVAIEKQFYDNFRSLHGLVEVSPQEANIAWFLYALSNEPGPHYELKLERTIYMRMEDVLDRFSHLEAGSIHDFEATLRRKLSARGM